MTSAEASHWQALCLAQQYELERLRTQAQPYLDWCKRHPAPLVERGEDGSLVIRCQEMSLTIRPEACDSELFELQLRPANDKRVQVWHLCSLNIIGKDGAYWTQLGFSQNYNFCLLVCCKVSYEVFTPITPSEELVAHLGFNFSEGVVSPADYSLVFPRTDALALQQTVLKALGEWSKRFRPWAQIDHAAVHKRLLNGTLQ